MNLDFLSPTKTEAALEIRFVPFMSWLVTTGGYNQVFYNANLSLYQLREDIDVTVNGVELPKEGGFNFSVLNGSIVIFSYLKPGDVIQIDSKVIPVRVIIPDVRVTQLDDDRVTQVGNIRVTSP